MHLACAQLVLSMMEDSDAQTQRMAEEIEETLDIVTALRLIDECVLLPFSCYCSFFLSHDYFESESKSDNIN